MLVEWIYDDFGIDLVGINEITHGADAAAQLWRGADAGGRSYAIKLTGGGTAAGLVVTGTLAIPGVVSPVRTPDGRLWTSRDGRRLFVVPWISDRQALSGMSARQWRAYGVLLGSVHAAPATEAIADMLPVETYAHVRATAVVRGVHELIRNPVDSLAAEVASSWNSMMATTILAGADHLARTFVARPAPNVICHADPHLGNVLLDDAGDVVLIDWDDAMRSPRERDLMFVLDGGLAGFAPVSEHQRRLFFEGYGAVEIDPLLVAYFQCIRALEDLDFALTGLDPDAPVADRAFALRIVRGIFSETGLATVAQANLNRLGVTSRLSRSRSAKQIDSRRSAI